MQCHEFVLQAEQWMEGESSVAAKSHLDSCANCRSLVADLNAICSSATELPSPEPPERIWVSLRNQLAAEGLIKEEVEAMDARTVAPARARFGFLPSLRPALAAAYLTVALLIGGYFALRNVDLAPGADQAAMLAMPVSLSVTQSGVISDLHEHNPAVVDSYKQNLQIVDDFILMCEKTVKKEPRNETAREYLYNAYQQKAELLAMISERGAMGD